MKLALLIALAACTTPTDAGETQITQELGCGSWGCGTNSATVGDGLIFDELDSSGGTPNGSGLRIVAATASDGRPMAVRVKRHELIADALDGSRRDTGVALTGMIVKLASTDGIGYEVLVARVQLKQISFWAGLAEWVPFYELMARRLGEHKFSQYACKADLTSDPTWSSVAHSALVFQWDRYDGEHKLVTETAPDDPWFNVACAATAPAKLHLMRHTRAGSYTDWELLAYDTSVKQRQAMLKLVTADYCGTGRSFTVDGVPLVYRTSTGLYWDTRSYSHEEALWDANGALCLTTPRLATPGDVASECALPTCDFTDWTSRAYAMSAEP